MPNATPPAPPTVHAPHRPAADGAPVDAASPPAQVLSGTVVGTPPLSTQGATVTASVGGSAAPPPSPGVPTTATGRPPGTPDGGLARTGADVGLVLVFALVAVLLGTLLVRLGTTRASRTC